MGVTIHRADGTTEESPHERDEPDHGHDVARVTGEFGDYFRCVNCGIEAAEDQLPHVSCE